MTVRSTKFWLFFSSGIKDRLSSLKLEILFISLQSSFLFEIVSFHGSKILLTKFQILARMILYCPFWRYSSSLFRWIQTSISTFYCSWFGLVSSTNILIEAMKRFDLFQILLWLYFLQHWRVLLFYVSFRNDLLKLDWKFLGNLSFWVNFTGFWKIWLFLKRGFDFLLVQKLICLKSQYIQSINVKTYIIRLCFLKRSVTLNIDYPSILFIISRFLYCCF